MEGSTYASILFFDSFSLRGPDPKIAEAWGRQGKMAQVSSSGINSGDIISPVNGMKGIVESEWVKDKGRLVLRGSKENEMEPKNRKNTHVKRKNARNKEKVTYGSILQFKSQGG